MRFKLTDHPKSDRFISSTRKGKKMDSATWAAYREATACRKCKVNTYEWNGYCYECIPRCDHNRLVSDDCGYCG